MTHPSTFTTHSPIHIFQSFRTTTLTCLSISLTDCLLHPSLTLCISACLSINTLTQSSLPQLAHYHPVSPIHISPSLLSPILTHPSIISQIVHYLPDSPIYNSTSLLSTTLSHPHITPPACSVPLIHLYISLLAQYHLDSPTHISPSLLITTLTYPCISLYSLFTSSLTHPSIL